ncbi:MAG TPA: ester cyclase [Chloroflexota bacterium]|nr:ester cyclase [Chloroflexota bacterium]
MLTPEAQRASVQRLYDEVWNQGHLAVADELFAADYTAPGATVPTGPEGEKRHVAMLRAAFPDLRLAVEEMAAEGDRIAVRWTMTATERGGFMGRPPTGRRIGIWGVHFFRFASDRIAACWTGVDMLGLLIQLGVVASPWPAGADTASEEAGTGA